MSRYNCFSRYLAAKKSLDDRALNPHVWKKLGDWVDAKQGELRVLEVGCGIGTMIERLVEREVLTSGTYHAIDSQETNITVLRHRLGKRDTGLTISAETIDLFDFLQTAEPQSYDLLIAHAVLDLLPLPHTLPRLFDLLKPDGVAYLTLNFDGVTHFEPPFDASLDAQIIERYHTNMDERITGGVPSGDSQTGRHLFTYFQDLDVEIVAAGSSDWVVHPVENGYIEDEAYLLHFIIDTVVGALQGQLDLQAWQAARHAQIEQAKLTYIAHQIDFLCRPRK